jgi:hypothetical protein
MAEYSDSPLAGFSGWGFAPVLTLQLEHPLLEHRPHARAVRQAEGGGVHEREVVAARVERHRAARTPVTLGSTPPGWPMTS